ncbi:putative AP2 protein [Hordeum vulgare]|nr:putative AP2 protein [Hordeum vulgare]
MHRFLRAIKYRARHAIAHSHAPLPRRFLASSSASPSLLPRLFICLSLAAPSATMPSRRRASSGYRDIHERPSGTYYDEIRSDDVRLDLGTLETAHEAAHAYDAAAWRLGRPRV